MKNLTLSLGRLAIVLASALSLGACSRANYATTSGAGNPLSASAASAPQEAAPYVPVAAEESAVVKATPSSPAPTAVAPATPVATTPATVATVPAPAMAPVAMPAAKPAPKLKLTQRLAFHKITKKLDKLTAQLPQLKKQNAGAARGGLDSNLRSAILFGLVGLILLAFSGLNGVGGLFAVLGAISLIVGLVFLVLWLLDQA